MAYEFVSEICAVGSGEYVGGGSLRGYKQLCCACVGSCVWLTWIKQRHFERNALLPCPNNLPVSTKGDLVRS